MHLYCNSPNVKPLVDDLMSEAKHRHQEAVEFANESQPVCQLHRVGNDEGGSLEGG
jgi:hypothetical protein